MSAQSEAPASLTVQPTAHAPISRQERALYRPQSLEECLKHQQQYFDDFALVREHWRTRNAGYHAELERIYGWYVQPHSSVLEVGCATGELLAAMKPSRAVGIDLSPAMIEKARARHPEFTFIASAFENVAPTGETFDYIILSDLLGFVFDIRAILEKLKAFCNPRTRIIINIHSHLWRPILDAAEMLGLKYRQPTLNWVTTEDVTGMLNLAGFETIRSDARMLLPKRVPLLSRFLNSVVAPFAPMRWFCLSNWIVARLPQEPGRAREWLQSPAVAQLEAPAPENSAAASEAARDRSPVLVPPGGRPELTVSVICPCRNEAGNIAHIVRRLPQMGSHTELIFVEGNSKDDTYAACLKAKEDNPHLDISVYKQTGRGKKDAVWLGFSKAKGDVLLILDADISVPPEDLPAFYDAIASGRVEFVNGSRLVYPMEDKAMRFLNLCGNKFFSYTFSWLIGQRVKDTLCGTKVLLRRDYQRLEAGRAYFGDFDPFGDFDLLFGAAKLGLKIVDLPVRYRERIYGETQISRFKHGWMLLKMCGVGLLRLKMR